MSFERHTVCVQSIHIFSEMNVVNPTILYKRTFKILLFLSSENPLITWEDGWAACSGTIAFSMLTSVDWPSNDEVSSGRKGFFRLSGWFSLPMLSWLNIAPLKVMTSTGKIVNQLIWHQFACWSVFCSKLFIITKREDTTPCRGWKCWSESRHGYHWKCSKCKRYFKCTRPILQLMPLEYRVVGRTLQMNIAKNIV